MDCACEQNPDGTIVSACGAHSEWLRRTSAGLCFDQDHNEFSAVVANALYQRKRADFFERLLLEGKTRPDGSKNT